LNGDGRTIRVAAHAAIPIAKLLAVKGLFGPAERRLVMIIREA
jgi:hypothetical protein